MGISDKSIRISVVPLLIFLLLFSSFAKATDCRDATIAHSLEDSEFVGYGTILSGKQSFKNFEKKRLENNIKGTKGETVTRSAVNQAWNEYVNALGFISFLVSWSTDDKLIGQVLKLKIDATDKGWETGEMFIFFLRESQVEKNMYAIDPCLHLNYSRGYVYTDSTSRKKYGFDEAVNELFRSASVIGRKNSSSN